MPLIKTGKKRTFRHPKKYKYGRGFTWKPAIDFDRYPNGAGPPPSEPDSDDQSNVHKDGRPRTPGRRREEGAQEEMARNPDDFPDEHEQSVGEIITEIAQNLDQLLFVVDQIVNIITGKLEGIIELANS